MLLRAHQGEHNPTEMRRKWKQVVDLSQETRYAIKTVKQFGSPANYCELQFLQSVYIIFYAILSYHIILYYFISNYIILYYIILYYIILYHIILMGRPEDLPQECSPRHCIFDRKNGPIWTVCCIWLANESPQRWHVPHLLWLTSGKR